MEAAFLSWRIFLIVKMIKFTIERYFSPKLASVDCGRLSFVNIGMEQRIRVQILTNASLRP